MNIVFSARSHKGNIRANNEDNLFADGMILPSEFRNRPFSIDANSDAPMLLAVCDGMGGEESGEAASEIAVKKLAQMEAAIKSALPEGMSEAVQTYIDNVNSEIRAYNKRMGTTLALAVITSKEVCCFNAGDSRIYCLKAGRLTQVTNDHTFGAEAARSNRISAEQSRSKKNGNKLTKCIGIGNDSTAESYPAIRGKCRLMMCSDGLTDMVSLSEIRKILSGTARISDAAELLMQAALSYGGRDNITVIVADIPAVPLIRLKKFFKDRG